MRIRRCMVDFQALQSYNNKDRSGVGVAPASLVFCMPGAFKRMKDRRGFIDVQAIKKGKKRKARSF